MVIYPRRFNDSTALAAIPEEPVPEETSKVSFVCKASLILYITFLFYTRAFVRLEGVLVGMIFAYIAIKLSAKSMIFNLIPEFFSCIIMCLVAAFLLGISSNTLYSVLWLFLSLCVYIGVLYLFPIERALIKDLKNKLPKL